MIDLVAKLNDEQRRAVTWTGGPLLLVAGAGTGKTRVVTHRIAWLVQQQRVPPSSILAMTFTNKAAAEMRGRVAQLLGTEVPGLVMGTFHSVAARFLREHARLLGFDSNYTILDEDDRQRLIKQILKERNPQLGGRELDTLVKGVVTALEACGRTGKAPKELYARGSLESQEMLKLLEAYDEAKRAAGYMDFDDLLRYFLVLLKDHPQVQGLLRERFTHILVDEFQDTNRQQLDIVKLLAGEGDGFFAVGDDDQSIFSWRGARVDNIIHLNKDFPHLTVQTLEHNYRSTQTILDAAFHAISKNPHLVQKRLRTDRGAGEKIRLMVCESEAMEARVVCETLQGLAQRGVPYDEMAIFYRTNAQSRPFEEALRRLRIPHRVVGGFRFFDRAEVKDILAYARLVANPKDSLSLLRCINSPPRGLGPGTVGDLMLFAQQQGLAPRAALHPFAATKGGKTGKALQAFAELMDGLGLLARGDLVAFFKAILDRSGYRQRLEEEDSLEAEGRKENLGELLASVAEFVAGEPRGTLDEYLQRVSLVSAVDEASDAAKAVSLMTVHSAKGLEFDAVFLTGMEEGLFPHEWSRRDGGLDEERRLLHVAITRAKDRLYISLARTRARFGVWTRQEPSSLLAPLPSWLFDVRRGPARQSFQQSWTRDSVVDPSDSQLPEEDFD